MNGSRPRTTAAACSWAKNSHLLQQQPACWCGSAYRSQFRPSTASLARRTTLRHRVRPNSALGASVSDRPANLTAINHRAGCILSISNRVILMRIADLAPECRHRLGSTCTSLRWLCWSAQSRYTGWAVGPVFGGTTTPQIVCPRALCVDDVGDILIAEQDSRRLQVLDGLSGASKRCIFLPGGINPGLNGFFGIASSHVMEDGDMSIYASAPDHGCVYTFSKHTGKLKHTVGSKQLSWPTGVDLNWTGELLAVADERLATLFLFDVSVNGGRALRSLCLTPLGGCPYDVSFNPRANGEIAISCIGSQDKVLWLNTSDLNVQHTSVAAPGVRAVAWTLDDAILVSTVPDKAAQNPNGDIILIRANSGEKFGSYPINGYSYSLTMHSAGDQILLCNYSGQLLRIRGPEIIHRPVLKPLNKPLTALTTTKTANEPQRSSMTKVNFREVGATTRCKSAAAPRNTEPTKNVFDRLILDAKKKCGKHVKKRSGTSLEKQKKKTCGVLLGMHLRTQVDGTQNPPKTLKPSVASKSRLAPKANVFDRLVKSSSYASRKARSRVGGDDSLKGEDKTGQSKELVKRVRRKGAVKRTRTKSNSSIQMERNENVSLGGVATNKPRICIKTSFSTSLC